MTKRKGGSEGMTDKLTNPQLIMINDIKGEIEVLKKSGKSYFEIQKAIVDEFFPSYWCVTDKEQREVAINVALIAYAMTDEQKKAIKDLIKAVKA